VNSAIWAAIVAADVVGYSRLMGRDESGTLAHLRKIRSEHLNPVLAKYGGRLVKLAGDGALVEFASAVDALRTNQGREASVTLKDGSHLPPSGLRPTPNVRDTGQGQQGAAPTAGPKPDAKGAVHSTRTLWVICASSCSRPRSRQKGIGGWLGSNASRPGRLDPKRYVIGRWRSKEVERDGVARRVAKRRADTMSFV
jgi:hypothetical protein